MDGFTSVTFTPPRSPPHSYKFNSITALACDDSVSQKLFMSCIFLSPLMMLITLFGLSTFWEPNEDLCLLMARVSVLLVAVGRTRLDNVHKKSMSSLTRFLPPSPGLIDQLLAPEFLSPWSRDITLCQPQDSHLLLTWVKPKPLFSIISNIADLQHADCLLCCGGHLWLGLRSHRERSSCKHQHIVDDLRNLSAAVWRWREWPRDKMNHCQNNPSLIANVKP